jgi:hypothetical protein
LSLIVEENGERIAFMITAPALAKRYGLNIKVLRSNLRKDLKWHTRYSRWKAEFGSVEAKQMEKIAASLDRR